MEEQKLLTERRRSIDADINSNRELNAKTIAKEEEEAAVKEAIQALRAEREQKK